MEIVIIQIVCHVSRKLYAVFEKTDLNVKYRSIFNRWSPLAKYRFAVHVSGNNTFARNIQSIILITLIRKETVIIHIVAVYRENHMQILK